MNAYSFTTTFACTMHADVNAGWQSACIMSRHAIMSNRLAKKALMVKAVYTEQAP